LLYGSGLYGTFKYGVWITPILDRNTGDVNTVKANPSSVSDLKGSYNYSDLNRVESNCEYIMDTLDSYGYTSTLIIKTNWVMTDFPTVVELNRIRNNILDLRVVYHTMIGSPDILIHNYLDYVDANALEQNLENLYILIGLMIQSFIYCGTQNCGVDFQL